MTATSEWIRPWFPGGEDVKAGRFGEPPVFIGHIFPDCEELLAVDSDPREGSGWLDPRKPGTCPDCLTRHDPKLADELGVTTTRTT
ncbi:hypothetical protein [Nonomuraea bangladeshensis]|uniref:hypothetical protein n=1 Tax=Nonomuraea bangladeshensis TaxID=404385 RepID=UPI003C301949